MSYAYTIVINDDASDNYTYGLADLDEHTVFLTYEAAKIGLKEFSTKFVSFLPVAYGSAFPYEKVTFEKELEAKSYAPFGWGVVLMEDDTFRVCVGLLRMRLN